MTATRYFTIELIETRFFLLRIFEHDENDHFDNLKTILTRTSFFEKMKLRSKGKQLYCKETYEFCIIFLKTYCIDNLKVVLFEATSRKA